MNLKEILLKSGELAESDVVYARRPWSLDSEATVESFSKEDHVTRVLPDSSFEYFLEASLIQDISAQASDGGCNEDEVLRVLLYYAEHDAFPQ
jgi:hypothetical protein